MRQSPPIRRRGVGHRGVSWPSALIISLVATGVALGLMFLARRRGWSGWLILALGPLLWLCAMAGIMILTGGGLFATHLLQDVALINVVYLAIGGAYASLLLVGRLLVTWPDAEPMSIAA